MKTRETYFHQDTNAKPPHWVYVHKLNDPLLWEAICQQSDWDKTKLVQKELASLFHSSFCYKGKRKRFLKDTIRIDNTTLRSKSQTNAFYFYRPSVQFKKTMRFLVAINKLLTKQTVGKRPEMVQTTLFDAEAL